MRHILILILLCFLYLSFFKPSVYAYTIGPADGASDVTVSAYIGGAMPPTPTPSVVLPTGKPGGKFNIFGYTSPNAKVSINNPGMYSDTTANEKGYFEFPSFFSRSLIEDICMTAQDKENRVTMPVCIPPIPSQNASIGPILMPPTLSLNNDSFFTGEPIVVSGQTTPNGSIKLSLFTDESKTSLQALYKKLNPVRESIAATRPKQDIKVDKKGAFTLTLPSDDPQYYRTFAQTILDQAFSPKSVTLNFDIFPGWFIIMKLVLGFLGSLKNRIFEIVFFAQILIISYFIFRHFTHPHKIARMRALALREHPLPLLMEHELMIRK